MYLSSPCNHSYYHLCYSDLPSCPITFDNILHSIPGNVSYNPFIINNYFILEVLIWCTLTYILETVYRICWTDETLWSCVIFSDLCSFWWNYHRSILHQSISTGSRVCRQMWKSYRWKPEAILSSYLFIDVSYTLNMITINWVWLLYICYVLISFF